MIGEIFNILLLRPFLNALLLLYGTLGHNFALAIMVLTVVLRLITQPIMARQANMSKKMNEVQPELKELQKKYGKDRERMAQEQMRVYKEHGINPTAGCLPTLLQFPIWIAFYQAIIQLLGQSPTQLLSLSKHIYNLGIFSGLQELIPLSSRFLWLDLGRPDPFYIIPILVAASQFVLQKMMAPSGQGDGSQQSQMAQSMLMTMPLMFGFITISLASGLGLYFVISSLVGIVMQYFTTGWGGLLPQRGQASALAAEGPGQGQPAEGLLSAVKRLIAPANRDGEGKSVTAADTATAQPAAPQQKGGEPGHEARARSAERPPAASVQKGKRSGSRKKKR